MGEELETSATSNQAVPEHIGVTGHINHIARRIQQNSS